MTMQFFSQRIHLLTYITIAYIVGICLPIFLLLIALSVIGGVILLLYHKPLFNNATIFYFLCLVSCFIGHTRINQEYQKPQLFFSAVQHHTITALGRVTAIEPIEHKLYKKCITVQIYDIQLDKTSSWLAQQTTIQLYVCSARSLLVGDIIALNKLTFKKPKQEFGNYLLKEGITATLFKPSFDYTLIHRPDINIKRWLSHTKQRLVKNLQKKMSRVTFQLFGSIFLGTKIPPKKTADSTKNHFNTWGVTHYLARSGLHMVVFIIVWQFFLSMLPLPWLFKELLLLIIGILYCLLSWPSVAFNRALLMFVIYRLCALIRRQSNSLHTLSLVCLGILLHNPLQLFFLDFQLSFGLTLALALFNQIQLHHTLSQSWHKTVA